MADLTGIPTPEVAPLLLIIFNEFESFRRYNEGLLPYGELSGYFSKVRRCRIVICRESAELSSVAGLTPILAQLMACHLLLNHCGKNPASWFWDGIAVAVAEAVVEGSTAPGTLARYLTAEQQRGTLLTGEQILMRTSMVFGSEDPQALAPAESAARLRRLATFSGLLIAFLSKFHRRAFTAFIEERRSTLLTPQDFESTFGISADDALATAVREAMESPIADPIAPPQMVQEKIESELIPELLSRDAPDSKKRPILRCLGSCGFPWRADVLIRLADDDLEPLQREALFALENLAGRSFRKNRREINGWYRSLPDEVKSPQIPTV